MVKFLRISISSSIVFVIFSRGYESAQLICFDVLILEMRSVERCICPIATNCSNNYDRMHCACTIWLYVHFRSIIWRPHRVPRPQFSLWCENFSDSATNKGYIAFFRCASAHARNDRISTSGLKSDVTIVFLQPNFPKAAEIMAIQL